MLSETQLIWAAAGEPLPCDTSGVVLPARRDPSTCARCGVTGARYDVGDLISSTFVSTRNGNRLHAFGGYSYCAACVFCARTLRLRCVSWFASGDGIRFWRTRAEQKGDPSPDAMMALLSPPKPPFVCGIPLYGIAHGGEAHYHRTWWPGDTPHPEPLIRLQSKHVALYSRLATSADRYPVQVDDVGEFVLDRDLWLHARDLARGASRLLVGEGINPFITKRALEALTLPSRLSTITAQSWLRIIAPLRLHSSAIWWPLFVNLLPEETPNATT
jgi:hypothetical protein